MDNVARYCVSDNPGIPSRAKLCSQNKVLGGGRGSRKTKRAIDPRYRNYTDLRGERRSKGETHLILGELEPRGDDDRQARVMIMFGGLHADKHVVEVRGVRCHRRRRHRRRHRRRFLADYPPWRRCFHYHASASFVQLVNPLQRKRSVSKKKASTVRYQRFATPPVRISASTFVKSTIEIDRTTNFL